MTNEVFIKFVVCCTAKIRRLYDIANILTSLELIRKVHVTEIRGRKPAFKYIGPDLETLNEVDSKSLNEVFSKLQHIR